MKCEECKHRYEHPYFNQISKENGKKERCNIKGHRELCDIKDIDNCQNFKQIPVVVAETKPKTRKVKEKNLI